MVIPGNDPAISLQSDLPLNHRQTITVKIVLISDLVHLFDIPDTVDIKMIERHPPLFIYLDNGKCRLQIGSSIPSPCAIPCVKTVLPTPRSPTRVYTSPGCASLPNFLPSSKKSFLRGKVSNSITFYPAYCLYAFILSLYFSSFCSASVRNAAY